MKDETKLIPKKMHNNSATGFNGICNYSSKKNFEKAKKKSYHLQYTSIGRPVLTVITVNGIPIPSNKSTKKNFEGDKTFFSSFLLNKGPPKQADIAILG